MKTAFILPPVLALACAMGLAQTAAAPSTPTHFGPGTIIPAELSKSLDAKKIKPGDKVEARTSMDLLSHGQVVIPRNSKITGHVIQAKAHSKEAPDSMIGIAFDRISIKGGEEIPLQASIQAIARPLQSAAASGPAPMDESGGMPSSGPPSQTGSMGGGIPNSQSPGTSPYPSGDTSQDAGAAGASTPALAPTSQGAVGMKGLSLSSSPQGSIISSSDDNVHLDSGTQLMLKTQ